MPTDGGYAFVTAGRSDIERLMPVMYAFYAAEHLEWNESDLRRALDELFADPRSGRLLLIEHNDELAGYMMIGFCFSLEFGGRYGLLDELFVLSAHRGGGLAKRALAEAETLCRSEDLVSIRLEVNDDNVHARGIYERAGYRAHPRRPMTRWLRGG